jgi:uncharacterized membrane protein
MNKNRIEAFSDGVIAILITIMVLEFKVPNGNNCETILPLLPKLLAYILSFIYLGIYWNNHHHLFHAVKRINGKIMWANLHVLFWLSLIPFVTAWAGENNFASFPMIMYGVILFCNAIAYYTLQTIIINHHGKESDFALALGNDIKGKGSLVLYALGIGFANYYPIVSGSIYILVALIWLVPDKRIERIFKEE